MRKLWCVRPLLDLIDKANKRYKLVPTVIGITLPKKWEGGNIDSMSTRKIFIFALIRDGLPLDMESEAYARNLKNYRGLGADVGRFRTTDQTGNAHFRTPLPNR